MVFSSNFSRKPMFGIDVRNRGDLVIVRAFGELDLTAEAMMDAALAHAEVLQQPVLVDMTEVTFCGSGVFGQLIAATTRVKRAGRMVVVATDASAVVRPMTLLGLGDDYLTVVPDTVAALRRLGLNEAHDGAIAPIAAEADEAATDVTEGA